MSYGLKVGPKCRQEDEKLNKNLKKTKKNKGVVKIAFVAKVNASQFCSSSAGNLY